MKFRPLCILLLAACGAEAPPEAPPATPTASTAPERCSSCRRRGGPLHACARTRWCRICVRDVGVLHHRCGQTGFCETCRRERGQGHVCGVTEVCNSRICTRDGKVREAGANHACGRTEICPTCGIDRIKKKEGEKDLHSCRDRTRFCPRCATEVTTAHLCEASRYCLACRTERALTHDDHEDRMRFCPDCRADKPFSHRH